MNMLARFDENPARKQNVTDGRKDACTHAQSENSIPTTKFAGGIKTKVITGTVVSKEKRNTILHIHMGLILQAKPFAPRISKAV